MTGVQVTVNFFSFIFLFIFLFIYFIYFFFSLKCLFIMTLKNLMLLNYYK